MLDCVLFAHKLRCSCAVSSAAERLVDLGLATPVLLWTRRRGKPLGCVGGDSGAVLTMFLQQAWSNAIVPNFVTSNAFIARAYANVIAGLVRDMFDPAASGDRPSKASQRSGDGKAPVRGNPSEPVYIVEIGAGHGKLGFLLVTALMAMK